MKVLNLNADINHHRKYTNDRENKGLLEQRCDLETLKAIKFLPRSTYICELWAMCERHKHVRPSKPLKGMKAFKVKVFRAERN